jgi:hypothetical protein
MNEESAPKTAATFGFAAPRPCPSNAANARRARPIMAMKELLTHIALPPHERQQGIVAKEPCL